jgi:hypothetical protein
MASLVLLNEALERATWDMNPATDPHVLKLT